MTLANAIATSVTRVTKKWTKQRKSEEREANRRFRRNAALVATRRESKIDVAWEVMESAYMRASSNNTLPAHARQIMYAARGAIQERTGKPLRAQYFTQKLLPDFLIAHAEATAGWDVVFDARGHLHEPHTNVVVPLGTISVREYLNGVGDPCSSDPSTGLDDGGPTLYPSRGPENRFGAILFVEKEGFLPLFRKLRLAERFDLAIMSTKGMSTTSARRLVDRLCGGQDGVPLFVLHDFDKAGFSILSSLRRDTRRYRFENDVQLIDLGLRLRDVERYALESEDVYYGTSDPTDNLLENGATENEIAFLYDECSSSWQSHRGRRVELNAFSSGDLAKWVEDALIGHGVKKVVPKRDELERAFRRAFEHEETAREVEKIRDEVTKRVQRVVIPTDLEERVRRHLSQTPEAPWDAAVAEEAGKAAKERNE